MTIQLIRFLNILIAAILAGVSFGIWIGFNPADLSAGAFIEQHQNMLESLKTLMIGMVVGATVITLVSAYLQRSDKTTLKALVIAAGFFVACILITRFGNNPIDDEVMTWTTAALPDDWAAARDRWWSLHGWRTLTEMIALCIIIWVGIQKSTPVARNLS